MSRNVPLKRHSTILHQICLQFSKFNYFICTYRCYKIVWNIFTFSTLSATVKSCNFFLWVCMDFGSTTVRDCPKRSKVCHIQRQLFSVVYLHVFTHITPLRLQKDIGQSRTNPSTPFTHFWFAHSIKISSHFHNGSDWNADSSARFNLTDELMI